MNNIYKPLNSENAVHYLSFLSVALAFASIYTSKAGLSIALVLILITTIMKLFCNKSIFHGNVILYKYSKYLTVTYFIGVTVSFIPSLEIHDLLWFVQKGAYLLIIPLFGLVLSQNKTIAFRLSLLGLLVAICYSFTLLYQQHLGKRIDSFWDVGRWSEVLAYSIAILIPLLHNRRQIQLKNSSTMLLFCITVMSCAALLVTTTRGPLLFLFISIFTYYLISHRKLFIVFILFSILFLAIIVLTPQLNTIYETINSIFSSNNNSNNARLLMWSNAIKFIIFNIENNISSFLFGIGDKNIEQHLISFLRTLGSIEDMQMSVGYQLSFNDFHNAYLDTLVKTGFIFFSLYIFAICYLTYILVSFIRKGVALAWSGITLLITQLGIGLVYSNGMEYQTLIFYLMMTLILVNCISISERKENTSDDVPN